MATRRRSPRHLPVRVERLADGRQVLEVGGVVQSVLPQPDAPADDPANGGYWPAMLPARCPRRALLLGLGGGTVARLLARRCPAVELVGVECDEAVLATARAEFALDAVARLRVDVADAFAWVPLAAAEEPASYDYICLDLFEAGRLAQGALATEFLRQVAALLAPRGGVAVNLMVTGRTPEQLRRLRRVFHLERTTRVRGNVVVHARPLRPDEAAAPETPE
ncbi:MAG TPA: methyltransferase domain-containing protein [Ktedonobacterales bacterium]|nr:methyltransferase domain-containing protein [Ktedonobacterales bacterium]